MLSCHREGTQDHINNVTSQRWAKQKGLQTDQKVTDTQFNRSIINTSGCPRKARLVKHPGETKKKHTHKKDIRNLWLRRFHRLITAGVSNSLVHREVSTLRCDASSANIWRADSLALAPAANYGSGAAATGADGGLLGRQLPWTPGAEPPSEEMAGSRSGSVCRTHPFTSAMSRPPEFPDMISFFSFFPSHWLQLSRWGTGSLDLRLKRCQEHLPHIRLKKLRGRLFR